MPKFVAFGTVIMGLECYFHENFGTSLIEFLAFFTFEANEGN